MKYVRYVFDQNLEERVQRLEKVVEVERTMN